MNRRLLAEYTALINRARADWPRNRDLTVEQVESIYFGNPNYDEKGHLLAYVEDKLVGECSGVVYPRNVAEAGLCAFVDLSVLPEYRRMSIGTKLIEKAIEYLRHRHVTEVQVEVPAVCNGSRQFYEKLGFTISGKTFELSYNLQKDLPNIMPPAGHTIRSPKFPDENAEFLQVWNKANAESEESPPILTPEAFEAFLAFPDVQPAYYVAVNEEDNKIVGVLSCFIDPAYNKKNNVKESQIEIVGVLPEARRKGIASSLIVTALKWMQTQDITTALAIVDSKNKGMLIVANRLGAETADEQLTYKLRI